MERLVEQGKIRTIGVSNFTREKIEELFKTYVIFFTFKILVSKLTWIKAQKFARQ